MGARHALRALRATRAPPPTALCPGCAFASLVALSHPATALAKKRHAATLSSRTAVNATKNIPPRLQKLYKELEGLNKNATNFVSLSRLQLALRSLEDENPVIRIAVLGLQGLQGARQLARLLSVDALDPEGNWEKQLGDAVQDGEQSYILRYGHQSSVAPTNSLITTLYIPSPILQRHNLELLVTSLNLSSLSSTASSPNDLRATALVPVAATPSSMTNASVSFVRYPVHRAIVLGDGIDGAFALGKFPLTSRDDNVKLALNLPGLSSTSQAAQTALPVLDLARAAQGLSLLRQSPANGTKYQVAWNASKLPDMTNWLAKSVHTDPSGLPAAVHTLLASLLDSAAASIPPPTAPPTVSPTTSAPPLLANLSDWSLRAHTELQASLDAACASKQWSHLAWWKIPWRADDVTMLLAETLERHWLVDAEKGVLFLAGRAAELGVHPSEAELYPWLSPKAVDDASSAAVVEQSDAETSSQSASAQADAQEQGQAQPDQAEAEEEHLHPPWPSLIPSARARLGETTIPALHARAQRLTLSTLSISSSSVALSVLTYLSLSVSPFEAGAIAALGSVFAFWRMQRSWEGARDAWLEGLRQQGARVLGLVEARVKRDLEPSEMESVRVDEDEVDRLRAREAVERARAALGELEAGKSVEQETRREQ